MMEAAAFPRSALAPATPHHRWRRHPVHDDGGGLIHGHSSSRRCCLSHRRRSLPPPMAAAAGSSNFPTAAAPSPSPPATSNLLPHRRNLLPLAHGSGSGILSRVHGPLRRRRGPSFPTPDTQTELWPAAAPSPMRAADTVALPCMRRMQRYSPTSDGDCGGPPPPPTTTTVAVPSPRCRPRRSSPTPDGDCGNRSPTPMSAVALIPLRASPPPSRGR